MSAVTNRRLRRITVVLLLLLLFPALAVVVARGGDGGAAGTAAPDPGTKAGDPAASLPGPVPPPEVAPRLAADGDPLPVAHAQVAGAPIAAEKTYVITTAPVGAHARDAGAGGGVSGGTSTPPVAAVHPPRDPGWLQALAQRMVPALGGAQYGPAGPQGSSKPGSAAAGAVATPGQTVEHPPAPDGTAIAGGIASGMAAPGRATPVVAAAPGSQSVAWAFQAAPGAPLEQVSSTITVTAAAGSDGRAPASVSTFDQDGNLLVTYPATAFVDAQGITHIDAQGAAVSGPLASAWSPDSMAIDQYGYVHTLDDLNRSGNGWQN